MNDESEYTPIRNDMELLRNDMELLDTTITVTINEEWFMHRFEKVMKRHVKNAERLELILIDLRCVLREGNEM